jgi:hypothetical protein
MAERGTGVRGDPEPLSRSTVGSYRRDSCGVIPGHERTYEPRGTITWTRPLQGRAAAEGGSGPEREDGDPAALLEGQRTAVGDYRRADDAPTAGPYLAGDAVAGVADLG